VYWAYNIDGKEGSQVRWEDKANMMGMVESKYLWGVLHVQKNISIFLVPQRYSAWQYLSKMQFLSCLKVCSLGKLYAQQVSQRRFSEWFLELGRTLPICPVITQGGNIGKHSISLFLYSSIPYSMAGWRSVNLVLPFLNCGNGDFLFLMRDISLSVAFGSQDCLQSRTDLLAAQHSCSERTLLITSC